jgi:hypothetical protein
MTAVQIDQALIHNQPEPDIKRCALPIEEVLVSRQAIDVRLLQHIRRGHAGAEPGIEPELDHAAKLRVISIEQLGQRILLAGAEAFEQGGDI